MILVGRDLSSVDDLLRASKKKKADTVNMLYRKVHEYCKSVQNVFNHRLQRLLFLNLFLPIASELEHGVSQNRNLRCQLPHNLRPY